MKSWVNVYCQLGHSVSRTPMPQTPGSCKPVLWSKYKPLWTVDQCVQKPATHSFLLLPVTWQCYLPETTYYLSLLSCSAVYNAPYSLIWLFKINSLSPSCTVGALHQTEHSPPDTSSSFCSCVCVSVPSSALHHSSQVSRVSPGRTWWYHPMNLPFHACIQMCPF